MVERSRIRVTWLILAAVFLAAGSLSAATSQKDAKPAVERARASFDVAKADVAHLRAEMRQAAARGVQSPRHFAAELDRLRGRVRQGADRLLGLPWKDIRPALATLRQLDRELADIDSTLKSWPTFAIADTKPLIPPSHPGSGAITGTVVAQATGQPLAGVQVQIYEPPGAFVGLATTDGSGNYSVGGLGTGTYFASTRNDLDYVDELYDNFVCEPFCQETSGRPIPVSDGVVTPGIAFALVPFGKLSGTVADTGNGQPLPQVDILVYNSTGGFAASRVTDATGAFIVGGLVPGTYYVSAMHPAYFDELYNEIPCEGGCNPLLGQPIAVAAGAETSNITFALQRGGSISGTVTTSIGEPLQNVLVDVFDAVGNYTTSQWTDSFGSYSAVGLLSGTYFVRVRNFAGFVDELYDDFLCVPSCDVTTGTPINVTLGADRPAIDFALRRLGSLSGTVSDASTGFPLWGVGMAVYDAGGQMVGFATTDASGRYAVGGLRSGNHFVVVESAPEHLRELYENISCEPDCDPASGTPIAVSLEANTPGIDFGLDLGGVITGRVVAQSSGGPIWGAVALYRADGTVAGSTFTSTLGGYAFRALATGTYFMVVVFADDFMREQYNDIPCEPSCIPTAGTAIPVTRGQVTSGIDFGLLRKGHIRGRVTSATSGAPLGGNVLVSIYSEQGNGVGVDVTDAAGSYTVSGLAAGTYFAATGGFHGHINELYDNKECEPFCDVTQGTPIQVLLDTDTVVDFALRPPVFADVPVGHWARRYVEALHNAGITSGCATDPLRFCPDTEVRREQMAVFLLKAKEGPTYVPPSPTGMFEDVPLGSVFAPWIEDLAGRGITSGCSVNPPLFCPAGLATRSQVAPLLLRTVESSGYTPPPAIGLFQDVPVSDPFASWIEEIANRGVTSGCNVNPPLYCPAVATTRAVMAVMIVRSFGLPVP